MKTLKRSTLSSPPSLKAPSCGTFVRLLIALLGILAAGHTSAEVLWHEGFETDQALDDWFASNGVWEIGPPSSGPGEAHSGVKVAATILAGDYPEGVESLLEGPSILVPSAEQQPRLRWRQWFSFNSGDYGAVRIRVTGDPWSGDLMQVTSTGHGVWSQAGLDLRPYAGERVQIGFFFHSQNVRHDCCESRPRSE